MQAIRIERAGIFSFSYDADAFEIVNEEYQDDAEDSDMILTLNGSYASWGNVVIEFLKTKIDDTASALSCHLHWFHLWWRGLLHGDSVY